MSYVVESDHVESLRSGRTVSPRDVLSDAEARANPDLIERGVLVKSPDKRKQKAAAAESPVSDAVQEPAAAPPNKED